VWGGRRPRNPLRNQEVAGNLTLFGRTDTTVKNLPGQDLMEESGEGSLMARNMSGSAGNFAAQDHYDAVTVKRFSDAILIGGLRT